MRKRHGASTQQQFASVKGAADTLLGKLNDGQKTKAQITLPGLAYGPGMGHGPRGHGWHHH